MRVLLDENIHHGFRKLLVGHDVFTVQYMGWAGYKNGKLLEKANGEFDVLLTLDSNLIYQNDFADKKIAVITMVSKKTKIDDLMPLVPKLLSSLNHIRPGQVVNIFAE
jgi:hypothetical protein